MISISKASNKEESNGFTFEKIEINTIQSNCKNGTKSKIEVLKFANDNFYCIDFSRHLSSKEITNLLKTTFQNFLIKDGINQNFEIYLPDFATNSELFDSLTTIFYLGMINNRAFTRIQIAQDFEIYSTNWGKYSPNYLYEEMIKLGSKIDDKNLNIRKGEDDTEELVRIEFSYPLDKNLNDALQDAIKFLPKIENNLQNAVNSNVWSQDFHFDEPKFSKELIYPLLRKMKYDNVIYNHGRKEYGRDFIFSEINRFGEIVYYGMQIKAGDISGKVNSEIDMLLGQLDDAFKMPFYILGDNKEKYISSFIISISGKYMENAREKIMHKVPKSLMSNIYFWDKTKTLELIEKNWNK